MKRKPGYYHVQDHMGQWLIAEWYVSENQPDGMWLITGVGYPFRDEDWSDIVERRIKRVEPSSFDNDDETNF
ncbi:MAG: hypothetical protein U9O59_01845 [Actinomycetota bacterium]|nr:hypothetical protein [Actinomycetota bacterium]